MGIKETDRVMAGIVFLFVLFLIANWVYAGEKHHHHEAPNGVVLTEVINNTFNEGCSSSAVGGVAGQHQYKTSDKVQWSVAGAYQSGKCDDSALSFGLSWRAFDRPMTMSFSSNGDEDLVTIQIGGEF